jgi:hypothetical protein
MRVSRRRNWRALDVGEGKSGRKTMARRAKAAAF